jgi:hypothetical protein
MHELQHHSCALLMGGAVKCWGYNTNGEVITFEVFWSLQLLYSHIVSRVCDLTKCDAAWGRPSTKQEQHSIRHSWVEYRKRSRIS